MPVWRQLSLTHAGLEKLSTGGFGLTTIINVWSLEAFSRHFMLHLYSAHRATLVSDWVALFSNSNAAGTNECLDLSRRSCPPSGDRSLSYRRCFGSIARRARDSAAFWQQSSVGWMPDKIKKLSVDMGRRYPVTIRMTPLMGLLIRPV